MATSSFPAGPFTVKTLKAAVAVSGGGDLTLFVDSDQTAYVAYDAWGNNHKISIEKLTPDYLDSLGPTASTGPISPSGNEVGHYNSLPVAVAAAGQQCHRVLDPGRPRRRAHSGGFASPPSSRGVPVLYPRYPRCTLVGSAGADGVPLVRGAVYYLFFGPTCCFCHQGSGAVVWYADHPMGPWRSAGCVLD